jgi:isopenicillin-N N-acyltransferase like protein
MLCCIRDTQEDPSFQEHSKTNKGMLMLSKTPRILAIFFVLIFAAWSAPLPAQVLGRSGQGWLETIDGYPVVYVKGSHYEMGRQHGELLRERVQKNLQHLLEIKGEAALFELGPLRIKPRQAIETIIKVQEPFVPKKYFEELRGLADGAQVPLADARAANFIPELFHCSGFALMNSATADGALVHGRVLDYAIDWGLQEHAVLVVAEPEGGIPFVNVTYAGFLGSVTGMNARHVSIGEMGGGGLGHWEGVPMSWLVREVLEGAGTLDEAIAVFRDNPRTCQYFYVIADGKDNRAVGMEASWNKFELIQPGEKHPLLPSPSPDTVLMSADQRYHELARRVREGHGRFNAASALRLMDRPVAMKSNLHNVLFEPASTRFWVANASPDGQPAAEQKYHQFKLTDLLNRRPE